MLTGDFERNVRIGGSGQDVDRMRTGCFLVCAGQGLTMMRSCTGHGRKWTGCGQDGQDGPCPVSREKGFWKMSCGERCGY